MPRLFVDTAGWGHQLDSSQPFHRQASALYRQARHQGTCFLTTNYVLAKLVAPFTSPLQIPRSKVIALIAGLLRSDQAFGAAQEEEAGETAFLYDEEDEPEEAADE